MQKEHQCLCPDFLALVNDERFSDSLLESPQPDNGALDSLRSKYNAVYQGVLSGASDN